MTRPHPLEWPMLVGEWGAYGRQPGTLTAARAISGIFEKLLCSDTYWAYDFAKRISLAFLVSLPSAAPTPNASPVSWKTIATTRRRKPLTAPGAKIPRSPLPAWSIPGLAGTRPAAPAGRTCWRWFQLRGGYPGGVWLQSRPPENHSAGSCACSPSGPFHIPEQPPLSTTI